MSTDETRAAPRVALYVRQSDRVDEGISQQIEALTARAEREGWRVVGTYTDNETSASKERGPSTAWARMLRDIDAGDIHIVLAMTAARLLRRRVDVIELAKPRRSVRVVTDRDGIDTSTMGGRIMLDVLTGMAEEEIGEKEARAVPYRAGRRAAGHPSAGLVPFGYSWVVADKRDSAWRDRSRYAVVPEEAAVLRFMSRELLSTSGLGKGALGSIAATLNAGKATDENGESLGESSRTTREGKPWITTTIRRLLISPYPAALLPPPMPEGEPYNAARIEWGKCTPGAWDAILNADAVLRARQILLKPSRLSHDGDTRAKWLLAGVGRCGKCKGPLRSCMTKTTAQSVRGYRCTAGCFQRPAAPIEAYIAEAVIDVLATPGLLQHLPDDAHDVNALKERHRVLRGEREEAEMLYADEVLTAGTFRVKVGKIDAALAEIDATLAEALATDPLAEIVTNGDVRGMWESMTTGRRRAVLGALVHHVEVLPVGKGRRVVTVEQTEGTVVMGWKRAQRRVRLDRERSVASVAPKVPEGAHEDIAAALNA